MNVVSLVILLENAVCVVVQEDAAVAALPDIAEVLVTVAGAIVLVDVHLDVVVFLLVDAALAGHHHHRTVDEKRCHMPMAMASGIGDEAEVEGCVCINFWLS